FGFLYCLGNNFFLHSLFYHLIPGFDKFRVPGRMAFFVTMAASVLGGFGLQHMLDHAVSASKEIRKMLIVIAGAGALCWLSAQIGLFQSARTPAQYAVQHALASSAATTSLMLILGACGILLLVWKKTLSASTGFILLLALHIIDMNVFG